LDSVVSGFLAAHESYGGKGSVLMISTAEVDEKNMFDQFGIEIELWRKKKIVTIRSIFSELVGRVELRDDILYVDGNEISVIYMRWGYVPEHYPSEAAWNVREMFERSMAIKCPSIDY
jgi:hypothetical protein